MRILNNPTNSRFKLLPILMILAVSPLAADEVTKWNELTNQLALQSNLANFNPIFQSRMMAMMHAAMHDGVNSIDRRYRCYAPCVALTPGASPEAAAATAGYTVLRDQLVRMEPFGFPPFLAEVDAAYAASLAAITDGQPITARGRARCPHRICRIPGGIIRIDSLAPVKAQETVNGQSNR